MAQGKTATATVIINNKPSTTTTKVVELVVINQLLVPDPNEVNPGVNSVPRN